ncbi:MAG: glycosyltransferase family 2 protein [Fuerstiella sp.]
MCVSVVILTFNEERNLPQCLEALSWCDDIWVVDSFSTDKTVEIAKRFGARVLQRKFDSFAGQRNHAIDHCQFRHDWIFHLDADEVCTDKLQGEIEAAIQGTRYTAFRIPSKTMFHGRWLKYSGMYPTYQVRLGKSPAFRFIQVGHGQREAVDAADVGVINEPYLHYSFSHGIESWLSKHNLYSTAEARQTLVEPTLGEASVGSVLLNTTARRRLMKRLSFSLPFRPTLRFLYMFLIRRGFLDGWAGYQYCRLLGLYEGMIDAKVAELRSVSGLDAPLPSVDLLPISTVEETSPARKRAA